MSNAAQPLVNHKVGGRLLDEGALKQKKTIAHKRQALELIFEDDFETLPKKSSTARRNK